MPGKLAPIVLFVYNRPWHTIQCLESLLNCDLAAQSVLYIYADGPKAGSTEEQLNKIADIRQLIRTKQWCKEVNIIESNYNKGLAQSVIGGISEVVHTHGKVIVLEDDIVVSKGFLSFMNEGLDTYDNDSQVYGISAYAYPKKNKNLPETYFLHMGNSWGWATWKRAWDKFNFNVPELITRMKAKGNIDQFNVGGFPFFDMLLSQDKAAPDTWDIQCYASLFLANGVFLFPRKSLCKNIGFDDSGTHRHNDQFMNSGLAEYLPVKRCVITELKTVRRGIEKSFEEKKSVKTTDKILLSIKRLIKKIRDKKLTSIL